MKLIKSIIIALLITGSCFAQETTLERPLPTAEELKETIKRVAVAGTLTVEQVRAVVKEEVTTQVEILRKEQVQTDAALLAAINKLSQQTAANHEVWNNSRITTKISHGFDRCYNSVAALKWWGKKDSSVATK